MTTSNLIRTGGGTFDPDEPPVYFLASGPERLSLAEEVHHHLLVAVNEIDSDKSMLCLDRWMRDSRKRIFLDSGVYNLAMSYARAHNVSMDQALSLSPEEIDGFPALFERYVQLAKKYGERLWGYIEIDQGGCDNKIKTRARLEAMGLRPIPVYHPLNDGWDYFDYLAERYDRLCLGNIVAAPAPTRLRLLSTAWERHRKYPHLWIHALGLTPNEWMGAMPVNSGDSSSWLHPVRWAAYPTRCDGLTIGYLGQGYRYVLTRDGGTPDAQDGSEKAIKLCGYNAHLNMLTWRRHTRDLAACGFQRYPTGGEVIRG